MLFLEPLRFHDRLNFLRNELMDDGVGGSSGLDRGGGDLALADAFCARGPDGLTTSESTGKSAGPSSGSV
jgi:hypothetical protein